MDESDESDEVGEAGETYAGAGVHLGANDEVVRRIETLVASTSRPGSVGGFGGFAGMFDLAAAGVAGGPLLAASTDGVGTKALVARDAGRVDTLGLDLVAMCVDDLVCVGARPLFLLDYVALGKDDPDLVEQLVAGIAEGCRRAGCVLLAGETAVHPGGMEPGDFDLAGFAVGVVDPRRVLGPEEVAPGDVLVGLWSPGLRSNGYSLARRVLLERAGLRLGDPVPSLTGPRPSAGRTLADELLEPSVIYAPAVLACIERAAVGAAAHITGGGIPGNLSRVLPAHADAELDRSTWEEPAVFGLIRRLGAVDDDEMSRVFNLGLGMVLVVAPADESVVLETLEDHGVRAAAVGRVVEGAGQVHLVGREAATWRWCWSSTTSPTSC
jgi:phosphoribosylformylglycinamidine cyclo-ligase